MAFTSSKTVPSGSVVSLTNEQWQFGSSPFTNSIGLQYAIGQSIVSNSTTTIVTLSVTEPDTTYAVFATGNFSAAAGIFLTGKSTSTFTVGYNAIHTVTGTFDWLLLR